MAAQLKIDFVSDVSCPWCVIGLKGEVGADLRFQPFELNPEMGVDGQDIRKAGQNL